MKPYFIFNNLPKETEYKLFLKLFPNDELVESVNYEINLLEEKERLKNNLLDQIK